MIALSKVKNPLPDKHYVYFEEIEMQIFDKEMRFQVITKSVGISLKSRQSTKSSATSYLLVESIPRQSPPQSGSRHSKK